MPLRLLTPDDAAAARELRLRALRDDPAAFGSTYADEVDRPTTVTRDRLADPDAGFVFGAFDDAQRLVGVVGCYPERARKRRHIAVIWGMFVAGEARGRGIGRALLDACVVHVAALWPHVELIQLTVVPDQAAARALYAACGFRSWGIEPRAMRDERRHYDMEHMWLPVHGR